MNRFFAGKNGSIGRKNILSRISIVITIIFTIMCLNFSALKVEASTSNYGVTVWTTDKDFVEQQELVMKRFNLAPTGYIQGIANFYERQGAHANLINGGHLSADSLNGTNLLWVFLPNADFNADDITYMRNFLATGGRIVFCGENPSVFRQGDEYISQAVESLGGNFTIMPEMHNPITGVVQGARLSTGSSLTDGVTGFYYAAAAQMSYSGATKVVLNALDDLPLAVDEAVGKGRITMFADINIWDPVLYTSPTRYMTGETNGILFANLMKDAKMNQDTVTAGGDPNAGFGLKVENPTANPIDGSIVASGSMVTISTATTGAAIHYTTDSTTPSSISTTGSAITVNGTVGSQLVIKAIATKNGMNNSDVATFTYTIVAAANSSIRPVAVNFNKNASAANKVDIPVTMTLNGNTLSSIKNGTMTLTAGTDYEVSGNTVTIKKEYLANQELGIANLSFKFSGGADQSLTIVVTPFAGGDGTEEHPYQIETAEQLSYVGKFTIDINYNPNSFILNNDIDLNVAPYNTGSGWTPIARFCGKLNGNDKIIKNLMINRPDEYNVGLFKQAGSGNGFVKNLGITNAQVIGKDSVGILMGNMTEIHVEKVFVTGVVNGEHKVGGLVGDVNYAIGTVVNCYSRANVNGRGMVGGLVGSVINSRIKNSYASGKVTLVNPDSNIFSGTTRYQDFIGGLIGASNPGGYSWGNNILESIYYDTNVSTQNDDGKGTKKSLADMKMKSTFIDWDFDTIWDINPSINDGYPHFKGSTPVVPNQPQGSGKGSDRNTSTNTVIGKVIDKDGNSVKGVDARVSTETNGTKTVETTAKEAILVKQPDGTKAPLSDISKLSLQSKDNANVSISSDGTIKVKDLAKGTETKVSICCDLGNGQKIVIGTIVVKVGSSGDVSLTSTLIDPYGTITDAATGKVIEGAAVKLYYANTERNKAAGKAADTLVQLPIINGFKPNDNKNPQMSDINGAYGFMVFPTADYYIVATKDGYNEFKSPTIPVEQDIVKLDFKMNKPSIGLNRLSGLNRIDTAIEIAKASYTGKVSNVILASADGYADALTGSVLAYKLNAPILLVGTSSVEQEKVLAYMKENMDAAGNVHILGGTGVVTSAFEANIGSNGFKNITRLGGADRYETSLKIAKKLDTKVGAPVVLAYGEDYPDALSISSIAAVMQYPILLVQKDKISDAVEAKLAEIKPIRVYIIGLQGGVNSSAEEQVAQAISLAKENIVRIGGADRYETSIAVAKYFNLTGENVCIATGESYPDAIAGSVYSANLNSPMLLVDKNLSDNAINYLKTRKITGVKIFGGEAVVSKEIEKKLLELIVK